MSAALDLSWDKEFITSCQESPTGSSRPFARARQGHYVSVSSHWAVDTVGLILIKDLCVSESKRWVGKGARQVER